MLERERALDGRAREAREALRDLRVAVRGDEGADARDLFVGGRRVAGPHGGGHVLRGPRVRELEPLEDHVRRIADLGRGQPGLAVAVAEHRPRLAQSGEALDVEPVRAELEESERAVREPADAVLRRLRHRDELRQPRRLGDRDLTRPRRRRARAGTPRRRPCRSAARRAGSGRPGASAVLRRARSRPGLPPHRRAPAPRAGRAPSRSESTRRRSARGRSSRRRSAGRSRASSPRSRDGAAPPPTPRPRPP